MSVNEDAFDVIVGHRLNLLRFEAGTAADILRAYDAAFADVTAELARATAALEAGASTDALRVDRLTAASADLAEKVREANRVMGLTMEARLAEAAIAEQAFQAGALADTIGVAFARVPDRMVALALTSDLGPSWVTAIATDLYEATTQVRDVMARALATGASIPKTAALLRRSSGLVETYRGRFVAIARTEVQRVANDVAAASYAENADVLSGVQWLSTLDSRTCLVCAPKHNTVYPLVLGQPVGLDRRPPVHPRCRCFLAPVVREWGEIVAMNPKRAAELYDGRPALDTDFEAWLKRKPADTAREVLGEARYDLWRSGTPLAAFSDGRRVLNLGELQAGNAA